jgi:hypothetical protein
MVTRCGGDYATIAIDLHRSRTTRADIQSEQVCLYRGQLLQRWRSIFEECKNAPGEAPHNRDENLDTVTLR